MVHSLLLENGIHAPAVFSQAVLALEGVAMSTLNRIESAKDLIQESVDRTVTGVENIHQSILDFPFAAFERKDGEESNLDPRVQNVRDAKTRAVSSIYGLVRQINNDVGELLSDLIGNVEDHVDEVEDLVDDVEDFAKDTIDDVEDAVKDVVEDVEKAAKDVVAKGKEKAKVVAAKGKEKAKDVKAAAKKVKTGKDKA